MVSSLSPCCPWLQEGGEREEPGERQAGCGGAEASLPAVQCGNGGGRLPSLGLCWVWEIRQSPSFSDP